MGTARYLVAKYVPDIYRNEPVNIGVLTWIDGRVCSRFLGQKNDGTIDGRAAGISGRIKSAQNYKQWIESWVTRLQGSHLQTREHGVVKSDSSEFLTALATYGGGNYLLESGGEIMDEPSPDEVSSVTDYLFNTLVGIPDEKEHYKSPDEVRDELLKEAEVLFDDRIKLNRRVPLQLRGRDFNPEFSLYIGNGNPDMLGQMVPLTSQGKTAQNSARAAELLFLQVLNADVLPQEKCIAFVYTREDEESTDLILESLSELSSVATIFDITRDRKSAVKLISQLVKESKRH